MVKRIITIIMAVIITFTGVIIPYNEVKAFDIPTAFWGTLEASRAFWTALQAGGGVRGGGVSFSTFELSSRDDVAKFQTQILIAYKAFCIYKEKLLLKQENPGISSDELNSQSEINGDNVYKHFYDNAINQVNNSTHKLNIKDWGYWKEFCDNMHDISVNGLGGTTDISVYKPKINCDFNNDFTIQQNVASNSIEYNGKYYVGVGDYPVWSGGQWTTATYNPGTVPTDRIRIPFIYFKPYSDKIVDMNYMFIDVNRLSGAIISENAFRNAQGMTYRTNDLSLADVVQLRLDNISLPVIITDKMGDSANNYKNSIVNNFENTLSISGGDAIEAYQELINDSLDDTIAGQAIKEGANADDKEIIGANSIPVKRSSIKVGEEEATGVIGWDVPDARTLEGAIAVPDTQEDVVEGMGIISVPEDIATVTDDTISWDKTEPIAVPIADNPAITDNPAIDVPITDVISEQGGEFYPTKVDITGLFPFCIPFDIAYCINKFHVPTGSAPVIHIPIVYPRVLQGVLGQSYDVIIDFNDYITLRNVIRYFILLFFLIGLMGITRNLIRG